MIFGSFAMCVCNFLSRGAAPGNPVVNIQVSRSMNALYGGLRARCFSQAMVTERAKYPQKFAEALRHNEKLQRQLTDQARIVRHCSFFVFVIFHTSEKYGMRLCVCVCFSFAFQNFDSRLRGFLNATRGARGVLMTTDHCSVVFHMAWMGAVGIVHRDEREGGWSGV